MNHKPAGIRVGQPNQFEFVINLKAAKQIALTIPPNVSSASKSSNPMILQSKTCPEMCKGPETEFRSDKVPG
jgi:hypothetical protein